MYCFIWHQVKTFIYSEKQTNKKLLLDHDFPTSDKGSWVCVQYKQRFRILKCHLFIDFLSLHPRERMSKEGAT